MTRQRGATQDLYYKSKSAETRENRNQHFPLNRWKSNSNLHSLGLQLKGADASLPSLAKIQSEPKDLDPKQIRAVGLMVTFLGSWTGTESDQAAEDPQSNPADLTIHSGLEPRREENALPDSCEGPQGLFPQRMIYKVRLKELNLSPKQGAWDLERTVGIPPTGQGLYSATLLCPTRSLTSTHYSDK